MSKKNKKDKEISSSNDANISNKNRISPEYVVKMPDKNDKSGSKKVKNHRKKIKLSSRLFRVIALTLVLVMAAIIFATYRGLDTIFLIKAGIDSFKAADNISRIVDEQTGNEFFASMEKLEATDDVSVEILKKDDSLVYSTFYNGDMSSPPYDSSSVIIPSKEKRNYMVEDDAGDLSSGNHFELRMDTINDVEYLIFVKHLSSGETINVYQKKAAVDSNARVAVSFISIVTIIVLAVALIIVMAFVRKMVKPLVDMQEVTKKMSELDFSHKCRDSSILEISELSVSINAMSDSLQESLEDLRQKNEKLQKDIEQEKTIDQLRNIFISGVSHELKTPISIIQGYAQGVEDYISFKDYDTAARYSGVIVEETERMNKLVMKLLEIIKYDSGDYTPVKENFRIAVTVGDWFDRNKKNFEQNGVTPIMDVDKNIIVNSDMFMVQTVLNNYLSNAMSHVDGRKIIKAWASETKDGAVRISIFNTGTPIADKDIDKIWDSFYRADKSLSRSQGRFGLGLSIVASIQKLLKEKYGVINHDDGVEFWFDIEKSDKLVADGETDSRNEMDNIKNTANKDTKSKEKQ